MEVQNQTTVTEFILTAFPALHKLQVFLFAVLLVTYMLTLTGNGVIISLIWADNRLQTPMYFFLSNLSFLDILYTTSVTPKLLACLLEDRKTISLAGCITQTYFFFFLGTVEFILLVVMSFDRYVAICNPLRYPIIMNRVLYVHMAAWSWIIGCLNSLVQTVLTVVLPFCGNNIIDHLTCEILALLKLTCSDITVSVIVMTVTNIVLLVIPLLLIFISYVFILSSILRINSAEGRKKAFSTCSAHLTVVILFYGSALFMYMKPKSKGTNASDEIIGLSYGVVTPMLNPIIYSLRNKEVKEAGKKVLTRYLPLLKT